MIEVAHKDYIPVATLFVPISHYTHLCKHTVGPRINNSRIPLQYATLFL